MISPLAHIDPEAKIGRDVTIYPFACIDKDVEIGDGCVIMSFASVCRGTKIGNKCRIYQGAIVGADPQDFRWNGEPSRCEIGDNTVIRENVIVNRGFMTDKGTFIGADSFVMANSHVGHDSRIVGKCVIGNNVSIAGDVEIGKCSILSSAAVVHEGCRVGDWVLVKGGCRIGGNVPPFCIMAHNPTAYFGVNAVVMRKHGYTDEQIDDVAKCYRHVYQTGTSVFNALRRIEADVEPSEYRDNIVNFIRGVGLKIVAIPKELE